MPTPRRILIDLDTTLYPSDPVWVDIMREAYGIELDPAELTEWHWYERFGLTTDAFHALVQSHFHSADQIMANAAHPGAAAVLQRWTQRGHEIHIVSDRDPATDEITRAWLAREGLAHTTAHFEWNVDKLAYARTRGFDLIIDDRPGLLQAVAEQGRITPATIRHQYNEEVRGRYAQIVSADTWTELGHQLDRLLDL